MMGKPNITIYSRLLMENICIVKDERRVMQMARTAPEISVYMEDEIHGMKKMEREEIKFYHMVKKVFNGIFTKA